MRTGVLSLVCCAAMMLCAGIPLPARAIIYVSANANGADDGTSWTNAYTNLVDAMNENTTEEIWVAVGVYNPLADNDDIFKIDNHPAYGGFAGTETNRNQRNAALNVTILTGDLGTGTNARRVVQKTFAGVAVLDGFTIRDGLGPGTTDDGAGLHVTAGTMYVTDVTFTNNSSGRHGGAIYVSGGSTMLTISNCTFANNGNTANATAGDGGAIYVHSAIGGFSAADCRFDNNVSDDDGGDIYVSTATIDITLQNSTFVGSRASGTGSEGGSIYSSNDGSHTFRGCTFRDTATSGTSTDYGGAIYNANAAVQTNTFMDCHFSNCRLLNSTAAGGAISVAGGAFIMSDCTFTNVFCVQAAGDGGAIDIRGGVTETDPVVISNCIFNMTFAGAAAEGGALDIDNRSGMVTFSDCVFTNTGAGRNGGAISVIATGTKIFRDCTFNTVSNHTGTTDNGGAIYSGGNASNRIENCSFENARVHTTGSGGAVYLGGGDCVIINNIFLDCHTNPDANGKGGALYHGGGAGDAAFISNCTFRVTSVGTNANGTGGAVHLQTPGEGAIIADCLFTNTHSGYYGGALFVDVPGGDVTIRDCNFLNCHMHSGAGVDGGAVKISGSAGTGLTRVENCRFEDVSNAGTTGAGALRISDGDAEIINCTFNRTSTAGGDGGALFCSGGAGDSVLVSNCTFSACHANSASANGGAIQCTSHAGNITIVDVTITNSSCGYRGAGIYLNATKSINALVNVTIRDVETKTAAGVQGGAVSITDGATQRFDNVIIEGVTFAGTSDGAAVRITTGVVEIENTTIKDVSGAASTHGGGISISGTLAQSVTVSNSTFQNITCNGLGGGIYVTGRTAPITLIKSTFKDCRSTGSHGGGVYLTAGSGAVRTIDSCRFENCSITAGNFDGAGMNLQAPGAGSRVVNSIFVDNNLGATCDDGGGIYQNGGSVDYLHCTFYTNTAADKGGAIYILGGTASFTNCIFRGSQADPASEEIHATPTAVTEIDYCNVDQAKSTGLDTIGANMFDTDPLFVATASDDLRLSHQSPLIDQGLTIDDIKVDITGAKRPRGPTSDIGAYENPTNPEALIFTIR